MKSLSTFNRTGAKLNSLPMLLAATFDAGAVGDVDAGVGRGRPAQVACHPNEPSGHTQGSVDRVGGGALRRVGPAGGERRQAGLGGTRTTAGEPEQGEETCRWCPKRRHDGRRGSGPRGHILFAVAVDVWCRNPGRGRSSWRRRARERCCCSRGARHVRSGQLPMTGGNALARRGGDCRA